MRKESALILDLDDVLWRRDTAFSEFCLSIDSFAGLKPGYAKQLYYDIRSTFEAGDAMSEFWRLLAKKTGFSKKQLKNEYLGCIETSGKASTRGMAFASLRELRLAAKEFDLFLLTKGESAVQLAKIRALGEEKIALFRGVTITSGEKWPHIATVLPAYKKTIFVDDKLSEVESALRGFRELPILERNGGFMVNRSTDKLACCWYVKDKAKISLEEAKSADSNGIYLGDRKTLLGTVFCVESEGDVPGGAS